MYEYFCALIVGIVEGLTEYIPVSSTGHLILVGHMLGFTGTLADVFDVFIQFGAILSVVLVYKGKFVSMLQKRNWFRTQGASCLNIAVAMFPACLVGLLCHGLIKNYLFGPLTVIGGLVLGGLFMIFAEKGAKLLSLKMWMTLPSGKHCKWAFFSVCLYGRDFPEAEALLQGDFFWEFPERRQRIFPLLWLCRSCFWRVPMIF